MSRMRSLRIPPAWQARLTDGQAQFTTFWLQRTVRERRLLTLAATVLLAWLIWALAVQPAVQTLAHSRQQLPVLRANVAQIQALAIESQALQRGRAVVQDPHTVQDALVSSLQRAGLHAAQVERLPDAEAGVAAQWQIYLQQAPAVRVVDWLASLTYLLQLETRQVDLARTQFDGRERPGQVSGHIELVLPAKGAQ